MNRESVSGYMPRKTVPSFPWWPRCGVKHAWQKDPLGLPTLCRFSQWVTLLCRVVYSLYDMFLYCCFYKANTTSLAPILTIFCPNPIIRHAISLVFWVYIHTRLDPQVKGKHRGQTQELNPHPQHHSKD